MLQDAYLVLCKKEVEQIFGCGEGDYWTHRNFIELSERIYHKTGIQLSPSTLKRIWGKVKPLERPHTATLDALAMYLGYINWADFREKKRELLQKTEDTAASQGTQDLHQEPEKTGATPELSVPQSNKLGGKQMMTLLNAVVALGLLLGSAMMAIHYFNKKNEVENTKVFFRHKRLTPADSLPMMVHFQFDIQHLMHLPNKIIAFGDGTSFVIKPGDTETTHQFNQIGYFPVRLYVNEDIKAFIPHVISTKQWHVQLTTDKGASVEVAKQAVKDTLLGFYPQKYNSESERLVTHYKLALESLAEYSLDNLVFQADFKSFLKEKDNQRHFLQIRLYGDTESILLQFKSYTNRGYNKISEKDITDDVAEKSAFVKTFDDWRNLTISTKDNSLSVLDGDNLIYQNIYQNRLGNLRQIEISFAGVGQIKNWQLRRH